MSNASEAPRRTQVERRAATVTKLLDSTIDAIVDLGYAGATTRVISERAGISQGGLFRHFPTRRDLIVAGIERLYDQQLALLNSMLEATPANPSRADALIQMRVVRDNVRQPRNMVFLEILLVARTEPDLLEALRPLLERQDRELRDAAKRNPVFARLSAESQHVMADVVHHMLAVEVLWQPTVPDPGLDDAKLEALVDLLFLLDDAERVKRATN